MRMALLSLFAPEQKKSNLKLLSKYILGQLNSENVEGSNDGGSSWYTELHHYLRVNVPKKMMHPFVSNKYLKSVEAGCLTVTSFLRISFGETRQLCW